MVFIADFKDYVNRKIYYTSLVERLNYKAQTYAKQFGFDSKLAQDYYSQILTTVPQENIKFKNGIPLIRKPMNLAKKGVDLSGLARVKTYGDIKKEFEKRYDEYRQTLDYEREFYQSDTTPLNINDFIREMTDFNEMIDKVKAISGGGATTENEEKAIEIMTNPLKTYTDLFRVSRLLRTE